MFNLILRQGSILVLVKAVQLLGVKHLFFFLFLAFSGSIHLSANFELCRLPPSSTTLAVSSWTCRSTVLSFSHLPLSQLVSVHLARLPPSQARLSLPSLISHGSVPFTPPNRTMLPAIQGSPVSKLWILYTHRARHSFMNESQSTVFSSSFIWS